MNGFMIFGLVGVLWVTIAVLLNKLRTPVPDRPWANRVEFKEPGSGAWMSIHEEQWWALSEDGALYAGGPWTTVSAAYAATALNVNFKERYNLETAEISAPPWRGDHWDLPKWGVCSLLCAADLHTFWWDTEPEALEYR